MLKSIYILLSFTFLAIVNSDQSLYLDTDFENTVSEFKSSPRDVSYRLPRNVIPVEYDVDIELFFETTIGAPAYTYNGITTIILEVVEDNTNQIVLHVNVDSVISVMIYETENGPTSTIESQFNINEEYHFLTITTSQNFVVGTNITLIISYSSTMNETPLTRGIFRGRYFDNDGIERIYATTHFQPYNARQAFPCFDEPGFKAIFTLHITHPESYSNVYSNTRIRTTEVFGNGKVKTNFLPTPKMSTYLVTFLVSEQFEVIAENTVQVPPVRIIARSNARGLGDHVLNLAVRMTDYFGQYFDIPYSTLHPNLLNDHIASPDWASAATENWGMVSYRELHMLIDRRETIMSVEHYTATLISHELAHKWFGNLITCEWWSNTWINEGFASYFGYIATHQVFPDYEMHEHFNSRYLQTSLATDSNLGSSPLNNYNVNTRPQITGHFGTISYSKGAAFLRMTANIITEDTFRKACRRFLISHQYEPTDHHDLFESFRQAVEEDGTLSDYHTFNFTNYYYTWVDEPGYPVLNVDIDYNNGNLWLSQERFFLAPNTVETERIYPIPITYSTKTNPRFSNLKPVYMFDGIRAILNKGPGEEWVIFNNLQHGHYRVNYDMRSWNIIADALLNEEDAIHHLNRAQIVDDVFALMRSERLSYQLGFHILRFLQREVNYHVWNPAISGYTWLRNRLRHLPSNQATFDASVIAYMEHVIVHLMNIIDFDNEEFVYESPTVSMTRQEVLQFACTLGHTRCVQEMRERFLNMRTNGIWITPRLRRSVYMMGIREGGAEDYEYLYDRMVRSNIENDKLEMLRGLGTTKDATLLERYLLMTLTDIIRAQDKVTAFNYALQGNPESGYHVLQFVKAHIDDIRRTYVGDAPNNPVHTALSNLASYLNEDGLLEFEEWLRDTQSNSAQYSSAMNAITSARNNIEWGNSHVDIIMAALPDGAAQTVVSFALMLTLAVIAVVV